MKKARSIVQFVKYISTSEDQREIIWLLAIIATSMVMLFSSIVFA